MSVVRVYFVYYNTIIQSVAPTQIKINNNKIRKMYENTKKKTVKVQYNSNNDDKIQ